MGWHAQGLITITDDFPFYAIVDFLSDVLRYQTYLPQTLN